MQSFLPILLTYWPCFDKISLHLNIGVSPSGKAQDFDSCMRRFKSCHPSQNGLARFFYFWQDLNLRFTPSGGEQNKFVPVLTEKQAHRLVFPGVKTLPPQPNEKTALMLVFALQRKAALFHLFFHFATKRKSTSDLVATAVRS